jgi:ribonuclease HII
MPMPDWSYERAARKRGMRVVCGIDEAGRGPLAGPVSVAAVVLPDRFRCDGIDDSKKISEKRREVLFEKILEHRGVLWAQVFADAEEIDRKNILRATHDAMAAAVAALQEKYARRVDHCLIDGLRVPGFPHSHEGIVKGDGKVISIAVASIIAKVCRDRLMRRFAEEFPQYGFEKHMGYGTKQHLEALQKHGPCRIHRRSFQPVSQLTLSFEP